MPIGTLSNSNTFFEWLTATNQLISPINGLVDGPLIIANTELRLTANGLSLNVANTSKLNVTFSNTLTINSTTGNSVYIAASANIARNVYAGNVFATRIFFPSGSIGGPQDISIPSTLEYLSTTANANIGTHLVVNRHIWQRGANATFNGVVLFSNTSETLGVIASGNVSIANNLLVSKNTITDNLTVNVIARIATLNVDTIRQPSESGSVKFEANTEILGTNRTLRVKEGILDLEGANTKMGPYTEKVSVDNNVNGNRTLNLRTASFFNLTLTAAAVDITVTTPPASPAMASATIIIKSGIAGATPTIKGQTTTGSAGTVRWSFGVVPTFITTLNAVNVVYIFTVDGGVNWYASAPILGATG